MTEYGVMGGLTDMPLGKLNRADVPREMRMHETADQILTGRIQMAHKLVSQLEDRLEPVCRRTGESTKVGGGLSTSNQNPPAIGSNTPLADVFNHVEQELSSLLERLDRLHNRIEL